MKKIFSLVFICLFAILLLNTFHEEYPDEYDSIVGGKYITQGLAPYRDWFQHHQPGAYVLASFILPFSGQSFVKFRTILAIAWFLIIAGGYLIIKGRLKNNNALRLEPIDLNFYILFLFITSISSTYFWGQMLLADTLSAYLIIPAYALLMIKGFYKINFGEKDLFIVSIFTFFTWFTSMTFTYLITGLVIYAVYLYFMSYLAINYGRILLGSARERLAHATLILKKLFFIVAGPYLLFSIYLLISGSLKNYYFDNMIYNQDYYIYNYIRQPGSLFNPFRYAIIIANTFYNNFFPTLVAIRDFPLGQPFEVTLALANISMLFLIILKQRWSLIFPLFVSMVFSNARSNPMVIKETDYQAAVYILISLFNGTFSLWGLGQIVNNVKEKMTPKLIASGLMMLLSVYIFYFTSYVGLKFIHKFYPKYMGTMPFIYDYPEIAPTLNKLISSQDYVWIGPFEFKELFYIKSKKLPSKYHWFLQHAATSKIKDELIADLEKNRPKIIVFKRGYAPWGGDAKGYNWFFTDFLDKNYFRIFKLNEELKDYQYAWKIGNTRNFDIDGDFNFDKSRMKEILDELLKLNLLEKT